MVFHFIKCQCLLQDIYAQNDITGVIKLAPYRYDLIKAANNPKSAQLIVKDAQHYYNQNDKSVQRLIDKTSVWLNTL